MLSQTSSKTAREISELDAQHVLVPWKKQGGPRDLPITRAEGVYFWNADGKRFLDFTSQFVFTNFGHGERRVVDAIARQAAMLPVMASSFVTVARAEAAQAIAEVAPGDLNRVFFSTGGAEANEAALKFARDLTGRPLVCSRHRSYHGSTYGAMTLSRDNRSWPFEPALAGVISAPLCDPYRCPFAAPGERCTDCVEHCIGLLVDVLQQYGPERIAGIIVEPITGSNGLIVPAEGYLKRLREVCDTYGILLICDEVMTGFGRTGRWFASDLFDIVPDIMSMAKGLTGGYVPLGATIVREELAKQWDTRPLVHGHTYSNHALACAAASAAIAVYHEDHLVERCAEVGPYLLQRAAWLMSRHVSIGDVRGKGLFVGMELVRNRKTKQPLIEAGAAAPTVKDRVLARAMEEGVYVMAGQAGSVIVMTPPLSITREQIDEGIDVLDRALALADAEVEASSTS